ncbi:hypothetical protein BKA69DRAFT_178721 [Paraphysoderma sedebokerense]|nr:hypothetical protein BKA69DRAFT_178721 [Paraphysoderma sedebokerense]
MPTSQPSINNPYAEAPGQDGPNRAHDRLDNNQRTIPLRRSSLTGLEGRVRGGLASDRSNRSSNPTENSNDSSRRTGQTITEGNDSYRETMSSGTTAQPNSDTVSQNVQGDPLAFVYDLLSGAMFSADNGNQRSTWTQASNPQQNSSATQTLVNQTSQSSTQTGSSGGFFDLLRNVMANGNGVVMFGDSGGAGIAGSRSNRVTAQARRTNGTVGTPASSSRPSTSTTEPQSNRRPENASASRSARRTTPTNGNNTSSSRKSTDASRVTYNLGRLGSLVSSILRIHDSRRSENPPRMLAEVLFPYSPSSSCDSTSMGYLYRRMAEVLTVREARQIMDGNPHALRNIHPVLNEYIRNTILNGSSITEDSIDRATSFFVERLLLSMDLDRYLEVWVVYSLIFYSKQRF